MAELDSVSERFRRQLRAARVRLIARRLCEDRRSRRRLVEMLEAGYSDPPGEPEPIAPRALDGAHVHVRPGSADADVLVGAFYGRYHLPADPLGSPALIWDLGANIGLTMRQMSAAYPLARIVGVELDPVNLELAELNLKTVADRVELVHGAVWPDPGTVSYGNPGRAEDGFTVTESGVGTATAITLDELRDRFGDPDYVKFDIEGAERDVLRRNTAWSRSVGRVGVEFHAPYSLEDCRRDLAALGFGDFQVARHGLLRRGSDSLYARRTNSASEL